MQGQQRMDTNADKFTPPGVNTTVANAAQQAIGERPIVTTTKPLTRPNETQLTNQWFGKCGM